MTEPGLDLHAWETEWQQLLDAADDTPVEALPDLENKTYLVTVGRNSDLNVAMDAAASAMIDLLEKEKKLTRLDAYGLASMVMDCRLAAPVAERKSVHCLVPKSTWTASR